MSRRLFAKRNQPILSGQGSRQRLHWPSVVLGSLALAAPLAACGPGFDPSSTVERARLVGARLSVASDPRRAAPLPGEEVTAQPWLVQPADESLVRATYIVCLAADIRRGASMCEGGPLALVPPSAPSVDLPPVTFTVPATTPATAQLILVMVTCDQGATPSLDAATMLVQCDNPISRSELATLNLPLADSVETANRHPDIGDETYRVQAEGGLIDWPASTAPLTRGCVTSGMPVVRVPSDALPPTAREPYRIDLTFTTTEDDRDSYTTRTGVMAREALQISHYVTAGRMSRSFSAVEATATSDLPITVRWAPPAIETIPTDGMPVRFTWIARDLRGGFARADRELCVTPAI